LPGGGKRGDLRWHSLADPPANPKSLLEFARYRRQPVGQAFSGGPFQKPVAGQDTGAHARSLLSGKIEKGRAPLVGWQVGHQR